MKTLRFAGIDIGTNAVRLLILNVMDFGDEHVKSKASLVRIPLRLGFEVFNTGKISKPKRKEMLKISWGLLNPDEGNPLKYELSYRKKDDATFTQLAKDLKKKHYDWDTTKINTGSYVMKLVASSVDGTISTIKYSQTFSIQN